MSTQTEEKKKAFKDEVIKIFAEAAKKDPSTLNEATLFDDLGLDSLDSVEMIMLFEEKYKIAIPDEEAQKVKSIADMIKIIEDKLIDLKNA